MKNEKVLTKEEKKKKKQQMKEMWSPRHFGLLFFICCVLKLRFNAHFVKSDAFKAQKKKGAMLVLCNHTSALDFAYFTAPFFFKKVSFVVAENMMYSTPLFAKMIKGYHAITRKQFYADYTCIKNMKRYLDAGISVVICPEGKVSAEGKTGVMPSSIGRLVKWLGYPVATVVTKGAGLTRPKWAYNCRLGKVVSHCDMLMTAEETKQFSNEEIVKKVQNALNHNEHIYHLDSKIRFRGKRYAEGLERLLYRCPKCGAEFKMKSEGNFVTCTECGNKVEYRDRGGLYPVGENSVCPERIDLWYDEEVKAVEEEIKNGGFRIEKTVNLFIENENKNGYRFVTAGTVSLDEENIEFSSVLDKRPKCMNAKYKVGDFHYSYDENGEFEPVEDEFQKIVFPVKNYVTVAYLPGSSLDFYDDKHTYRMMFSDDLASTKYALAIEIVAKMRE
ncbi:MAG: 1-acyl-sn-glycerol-3-phosphate acyltransferase [Clostridia bacterium]|nr:1-acyl-sn-glycerol-3-phosphate acyltransferase [Clostridia bacterium]